MNGKTGAGAATIFEADGELAAVGFAGDVQRIGQGARGPLPAFLHRQAGIQGSRDRRQQMGGIALGVVGGGVRQRRAPVAVSRGEVEGRCQVAADGAPPGRDVGLHHTEATLQETDYRGVVEQFGIDETALGPGGDDQHGHARPQPDRFAMIAFAIQLNAAFARTGLHGRAPAAAHGRRNRHYRRS